MAIYLNNSCDITNTPYYCTDAFAKGEPTEFRLSTDCLIPGQEILIRVWSADGTAIDWHLGDGRFKIGAYLDNPDYLGKILWGSNGEGSFSGGLGGWNTFGSCNNTALWKWSNDTMCTKGLYSFTGGRITSLSACNGAACFDADYYDTGGVLPGSGSCIAPEAGILESPNIDISAKDSSAGINIYFTQALRQKKSEFFIDFSFDNGLSWFSKQINTIDENKNL